MTCKCESLSFKMNRMTTQLNSKLVTNSSSMSFPASSEKAMDEAPLRLSSHEILRGHREVEVEHRGMVYRLRCTSLGKLILTK
jgi:hemin uptake protein HemP